MAKITIGKVVGNDATINGRNAINISEGTNITITDTPDGIEISSTGGGGGGSYTLPTASDTVKGGVMIGDNLQMNGDVLSVKTTTVAEKDNTLPITSAGVNAIVGNIEALLATI